MRIRVQVNEKFVEFRQRGINGLYKKHMRQDKGDCVHVTQSDDG